MKYSLRSLMVVVTLICVVLGGRIEYLRRMAAYHWQETVRSYRKMEHHDDLAAREYAYHGMQWAKYRRAVYRPWVVVPEPPEPTR
jgi:hypothetical protein